MRQTTLVLAATLLALSSLACSITIPALPDVDISRLEVGPMKEYEEQVPWEGEKEARVDIRFGAGEITLAVGDPDPLFSGLFRTNVAEWAPEVSWRDGILRIEQGHTRGIPDPGAENEWDLHFSPEVEMEMNLEIGAGDGELDFTGLALTELSLEMGAADLVVRFDEPNPVPMDDLLIRTGAANLRVDGIGNASPERGRVEGGVGNLLLDLGGEWRGSARVEVLAGAGSLTLRIPESVGARVEVEGGMSNIGADDGFILSEGAYLNEAYGEAEIELLIELTVGLGSVRLESIGE